MIPFPPPIAINSLVIMQLFFSAFSKGVLVDPNVCIAAPPRFIKPPPTGGATLGCPATLGAGTMLN